MSRYERDDSPTTVIATASSPTQAEMLKMTLGVNGVESVIDFDDGVTLRVRAEDEESARRLLNDFGLT